MAGKTYWWRIASAPGYEKRLTVGARFDLQHVGFELSGGYLFDRFFFEGEGYSDRHDNRLDVGSGPFVATRVSEHPVLARPRLRARSSQEQARLVS